MKTTRQGIRDLNDLGSVDKKNKNGRRDKKQNDCFHIFQDYIDDDYLTFKRCEKCGYEDV